MATPQREALPRRRGRRGGRAEPPAAAAPGTPSKRFVNQTGESPMKTRFFVALVGIVGLFAVGCAEEDAAAPESQDEAVAQAEDAPAEAEGARVEVAAANAEVAAVGAGSDQAKPKEPICIDLPWITVCCTPTSCVEFP
ncbi:MAG TPA: hypothetical protein VFS00_17565 [Polyangiaceae bacterium]|nr:hypothetical protein [Polyangiaceae bacterium]